jgi:hypothetical protein
MENPADTSQKPRFKSLEPEDFVAIDRVVPVLGQNGGADSGIFIPVYTVISIQFSGRNTEPSAVLAEFVPYFVPGRRIRTPISNVQINILYQLPTRRVNQLHRISVIRL